MMFHLLETGALRLEQVEQVEAMVDKVYEERMLREPGSKLRSLPPFSSFGSAHIILERTRSIPVGGAQRQGCEVCVL